MRDAGLSIKAWIDINDNDYDKIQEVLSAFTKWVKVVQNKPDPNDIDVRIGKNNVLWKKYAATYDNGGFGLFSFNTIIPL